MLKNSGQQSDTLAQSQTWIAYVIAGLLVFFATPIFHSASVTYVADFTAHYYDSSLTGPASVVWWVIAAAGIFFLSNAIAISLVRVAFQKFFIRLFR